MAKDMPNNGTRQSSQDITKRMTQEYAPLGTKGGKNGWSGSAQEKTAAMTKGFPNITTKGRGK